MDLDIPYLYKMDWKNTENKNILQEGKIQYYISLLTEI